jgi:hypothetical protein
MRARSEGQQRMWVVEGEGERERARANLIKRCSGEWREKKGEAREEERREDGITTTTHEAGRHTFPTFFPAPRVGAGMGGSGGRQGGVGRIGWAGEAREDCKKESIRYRRGGGEEDMTEGSLESRSF